MKILKVIGKIFFWIFFFVALAAVTLPLWVGPVVTRVANAVVPEKVGTDFRLGEFALNPYGGTLHVGDLQMLNPPGFSRENCVELGTLDVEVQMSSVLSKKIRIKEIVLDGLLVAVTSNGGNFRQIARHASGSETSGATDEQAPAQTESVTVSVEEPTTASPEPDPSADEEISVQIDRLVLRNLVVKIGMIPVPIPTIELTGIGADTEEGADWKEVWLAVSGAVMKSVGAIGDLGKSLLKSGTNAAEKAASQAIGATIDAAAEVTGAAVESLIDIFKKQKNK